MKVPSTTLRVHCIARRITRINTTNNLPSSYVRLGAVLNDYLIEGAGQGRIAHVYSARCDGIQ